MIFTPGIVRCLCQSHNIAETETIQFTVTCRSNKRLTSLLKHTNFGIIWQWLYLTLSMSSSAISDMKIQRWSDFIWRWCGNHSDILDGNKWFYMRQIQETHPNWLFIFFFNHVLTSHHAWIILHVREYDGSNRNLRRLKSLIRVVYSYSDENRVPSSNSFYASTRLMAILKIEIVRWENTVSNNLSNHKTHPRRQLTRYFDVRVVGLKTTI